MDSKPSYPSSDDSDLGDLVHDRRSRNTDPVLGLGGQPRELAVTFRLGWRRFAARGTHCDHHPNIVFLRTCPGVFDNLFSLLGLLLPTTWRDWLETRRPEFFLPPKIVMKGEKLNWEEEFENEKNIYKALAPIQGTVVPRLYGEARCPNFSGTGGTRALILSDVGGVQLNEAPGLDIAHLKTMLSRSIRAITHLKVGQGDPKLDNFLLVGDKVMVIDFDSAYLMDDEDPDTEAKFDVSHLSRTYQRIDWDD